MDAKDPIVKSLLRKLDNREEIDKDLAIKYFNLDSSSLQENASVQSDTSFSFGSHLFYIVTYAAVVNCQYKRLIEYSKRTEVFSNRLLVETNCDFDPSADHTGQTAFKIKGNTLYVYENVYKIRHEELGLDKKKSRYSAFRFPDLEPIFKGRVVQ